MRTVLLPPGVNRIVVKYYYTYPKFSICLMALLEPYFQKQLPQDDKYHYPVNPSLHHSITYLLPLQTESHSELRRLN
jgi:hypothetical protein